MRTLSLLTLLLITGLTLQAQVISIADGGFAYGCGGTLYDSGGDLGSGYGPDENFTITLCSDVSTGTHVRINWLSFFINQGDTLSIYDGMDSSAPLLASTVTGVPTTTGASFANTSGCLTLVWNSDGAGEGNFAGSFDCYTPCPPPIAAGAVVGSVLPALVCPGEAVTFDGSSSTAVPGNQVTIHTWDFADSSTTSTGSTVSHSFTEPGEYLVNLTVTDNTGCISEQPFILPVWVSTLPTFAGLTLSDSVVCQGELVELTGAVNSQTWSGQPPALSEGEVALPDGGGVVYSDTLAVTGFQTNATMNNVNDLVEVCMVIEHSYIGDLVVTLTSPNGGEVLLFDGNTAAPLDTYLGEPNDDPSTLSGTGWLYCFSDIGALLTLPQEVNLGNTTPAGDPVGESAVTGNYTSEENFSVFVGSPLNGNWSLNVLDDQGQDDGYIFQWYLIFNPLLYPSLTTFTPIYGAGADSTFWSGSNITSTSIDGDTAYINPQTLGPNQYVYSATNNFGCTFDTTITITVTPGITGPVNLTGDQLICDGGVAFINAPAGYDTYVWNNGSVGANISGGPGTYICTVSLGDCSLPSGPFTVSSASSPDPIIIGPSCVSGQAVLSTAQNYDSYLWSNTNNTPTITVGPGTYSVTVTNAEGCSSTSAPFVVTAGPTASYTTDLPSPQLPGSSITFIDQSTASGSTITDWLWIFDPENGNSNTPNTTNLYTNPGTYPVTLIVTAANGCTDTIVGSFLIRPLDIIIPNVFSPNGDNVNEALVFENLQFYTNSLTIFNRWGNKVYEKENYTNNWRATDVPDGTYFYVLSVPENNKEYTGHVTILR